MPCAHGEWTRMRFGSLTLVGAIACCAHAPPACAFLPPPPSLLLAHTGRNLISNSGSLLRPTATRGGFALTDTLRWERRITLMSNKEGAAGATLAAAGRDDGAGGGGS